MKTVYSILLASVAVVCCSASLISDGTRLFSARQQEYEYEYESFADRFCPNGDINDYFQCVTDLFPGFIEDCDDFFNALVVVEICVEANCGVQCEEVADIIQNDIDFLNEALDCELGPACSQLTDSPTTSPTAPVGAPGGGEGEDDELFVIILIVLIVIVAVLLLIVAYLLCSKIKNGAPPKIAEVKTKGGPVISM